MRFDFTGETDGFAVAKEGEQLVTVEEISEETSKQGNPMVLFKLRSGNGGLLYHYCLNTATKRWMLKKTLEAITRTKIPSGPVNVEFDNLIGEQLKVSVEHETYNGVKKGKVVDVILSEDEFSSGKVVGKGTVPF